MSVSLFSITLRIGLVAGAFAIFSTVSPVRADPYSLPIAQSGPVAGASSVAAGTVAARQLAAQVGLAQFTAASWQPGELRHVVMFRYRKDVSAAKKSEVTARFLHLAQDSRRPDGSHPVVSIETGMQNSGEGTDEGLEQAFIVTFRSAGDRNFYVGKPVVTDPNFFDPAHEAFKEYAAPYLEKVTVFDFMVLARAVPPGARANSAGRRHR